MNFNNITPWDITILTDSYVPSHYKMYAKCITEISGYIEARDDSIFDNISFFGLQYFLKQYLINLSKNLKENNLEIIKDMWEAHGLPFNIDDWRLIKSEYNGALPLEIQAVPEGAWVPKGNVLCQIRNTDPRFAWLTTWVETIFVEMIWYMSTVATVSKECKIIMNRYLEETGCENINQVLPFMLHDFGFRATSGPEQACEGGSAHLTNFVGSDTFPANIFINKYYSLSNKNLVWSKSIPASNHAVIMSWEHEDDAFQNILDTYLGPGKVVACVSDTYNLWRAIDSWGTKFKDQIENSGGRLVVRPDSGDAVEFSVKAIEKLMGYFGYTTNSKGYRVLPNCVRLTWSDGLSPSVIVQVLQALKNNKIAAENITFGMGSKLLQEVYRDMGSFAFKINEEIINGAVKPICKHPTTSAAKSSKPGRLALIKENGVYRTIKESELGSRKNYLRTVYRNGELLIDDDFSTIRERAMEGI